ncbi:MAG: alpha/beta hydrolase [Hymenobacteraceae bacterium]|nr:alpha/beta hydrolase [Hymenobacteraceae bacterium]MDX5396599.1 alpha/beta hydrolase [Hymenobacteraceae bacterium]MDX5443409.1 alpha/beta hydrolase [Hymenobacteraceae bacterium]MDX5512662.1 alpha/beta hydrolase [Hymenobacteraceae bacterium]
MKKAGIYSLILFWITAVNSVLAKDTFITLNGVKHWYKVAGVKSEKIPFVIIHGGPGGNNYNFERTIGKLLEQQYKVVYYEQRGSGRSEKPANGNYAVDTLVSDLQQLQQKLGFRKIIPLGYSFGTQLALEFALKHPEQVEKLVLESPAFLNAADDNTLYQITGFRSVADSVELKKIQQVLETDKSLPDKLNSIWAGASGALVDKFLFHNSNAAKQNRQLWKESGIKNNGEMFKYLMQHTPQESLVKRAGAVKVPVLLLVGVHDRNGAFQISLQLKQANPSFQLEYLLNSAHFPDMEETAVFYEKVNSFLQ